MACAFAVSMAICATASASALAADTALEPGFPVRAHSTGGTYAAGPATAITVGDIDGDAVPEIVASAVASGPLYAWHGDGTLVDGWPRPEAQGVVYAGLGELTRRTPGFEVAAGGWGDPILAWDRTGDVLPGWPRIAGNYVQTPPTLVDVDGDGLDEVFINESFGTFNGYTADGQKLSGWPPSESRATFGEEVTPAAADLTGDGRPELISVGGSSYDSYVFARQANGTTVPGFPVRISDRGMVRATVAVGDVDGDGAPEIVAPYIAPGPVPALAVVSASGGVERRLLTAAHVGDPGTAAAVLADLNGDQHPDPILQIDGRVDAWNGVDGTALPGWPKVNDNEWSNQSPVVGDVDGDQDPDVVVVTTRAGEAQGGILRAYDHTGALLPGFPKEPPFGTGSLTPAIGDVDGDGRNEIIVAGFEGPYAGDWPYLWVYDLGGGQHGGIEWGQFGGGPRHQGRYGQPTAPPPATAPASTPSGSAGPATRVADVRPGPRGSNPSQVAVLRDLLLLRADDGSSGPELYASDGTGSGTHLVADIWQGGTGSRPTDLVVAGDHVFFAASTAGAGEELWVTDGTKAGTRLVKDIWPGSQGSEPHHITAVGDAVFFSAWDGQHGFELWRSDGTAAGTTMVADSLVASSEPTGAASAGAPTLLRPFGSGLAYAVGHVDDNQNSGRFVMRTDAAGSPPQTFGYRLLDAGLSPFHRGDIAAAGGLLFLHDGSLLMRTDGSNANWTAFYDNEVTEAGPFAVLGGGVGFAAFGSEGSGRELWRLGQTGVPQRVADIAAGADSSDPQQLTPFDSGLMFRARTSASGTELWRSDGTAVAQVADIRPGAASSEPSRLTPIGSDLLFTADDGAHGHELWRSTGSAAGTHLLADIAPGGRSSDTTWIQRVGDRLVFDADDAASGRELWSIPLPLPAPPAPPPLPPPPSDAGSAGTGSTATGPTISSGDDSGTLLATSAQPSPLAPQELTTVTATEPGSRADRTPPRLSRPALQRRRAWVYLRFRVNEPGQVKVIAEVRRRGRWRTVATPLVKRCRKGVNAIRIPASLRRPGVRFVLTAMDTAGNRSRPVVLRTRN